VDLTASGNVVLSRHQSLHQLQVPAGKPQCAIGPQVHDFEQLPERHRVDPAAHRSDTEQPVAVAALALDQGGDLGLAAAALGHAVDYAHRQHIICAVGFSSRKKLFRHPSADPPVEEGIGPHAREQVEQDLGETEAGMLLGDHDVARQRRLEPAAQAIALHQRDGGDGQLMGAVVLVQNVNAGRAVLDQAGAVPGFDQAHEQVEVAAQIEHARYPGGQHRVLDRHGVRLRIELVRAVTDEPVVRADEFGAAVQRAQQSRVEAWARAGCPADPQGMVGRLVARGQLLGEEVFGPVRGAIGAGRLGNLEKGLRDVHVHGGSS
jgi:hypothetical protein